MRPNPIAFVILLQFIRTISKHPYNYLKLTQTIDFVTYISHDLISVANPPHIYTTRKPWITAHRPECLATHNSLFPSFLLFFFLLSLPPPFFYSFIINFFFDYFNNRKEAVVIVNYTAKKNFCLEQRKLVIQLDLLFAIEDYSKW